MHTKTKRLIAIFLSLILVIGFAITTSAMEPRYSDTNRISVRLVFIGTTANCTLKIFGAEGVTSIDNVNITLSDSSGNPVGSWNNLSSTGQDFSFFDTVPNLDKGEHYTLSFSAKVNTNTNSETVSGTASNDCPE